MSVQSFYPSFLHYNGYDDLDEMTRDLYRQGMLAFGGIAPIYHIALLDKSTIGALFLLAGVPMSAGILMLV